MAHWWANELLLLWNPHQFAVWERWTCNCSGTLPCGHPELEMKKTSCCRTCMCRTSSSSSSLVWNQHPIQDCNYTQINRDSARTTTQAHCFWISAIFSCCYCFRYNNLSSLVQSPKQWWTQVRIPAFPVLMKVMASKYLFKFIIIHKKFIGNRSKGFWFYRLPLTLQLHMNTQR